MTAQDCVLRAEDLELLIQAIRARGHQVIGPTVKDGAITYGEIHTSADLPQGWSDQQEKGHYRLVRNDTPAYFAYAVGAGAWKQFLQLPRRQVWQARQSDGDLNFVEVIDVAPRVAFLGVRSCELHAIEIQDRVFSGGSFQNESYSERRDNALLIAVNCTAPAATCFCTAMNTGPRVTLPADLTMTEVIGADEHYFLIGSGSQQGRDILGDLPLAPATEAQRNAEESAVRGAAQKMESGPRQFNSADVKDLLYRNYDSPLWEQVADRCLSCANCTMACPTCFCSTVEDSTDLSGEHAERWERWDSCFTGEFSYISGGSVRPDTKSRYRQWMTHKLATWHDQFGTSGCVGCGRCITWCPVGIDFTEEIHTLREMEKP
ncbi:4Fe-4S dicluster domain-containing protein [Microbulbifer sp. Q7]|uniref:4Fe-4S dicluster domain-containing protein n=1 Tax=Microbulbifer sp. Q7 TaxID=1785091 RepID=UPI001D10FCAE|nr:4Fe-4S dicluster domain-containing protein [Microbulbifer sp. Q7]